jgi:putative cell wall-binding protein
MHRPDHHPRPAHRPTLTAALLTLALVVALAPASAPTASAEQEATAQQDGERAEPYEIALRSRTFTPTPGIQHRAIVGHRDPGEDVHFFMQFEELPHAERHAVIDRRGFELLDYVGGRTYIAVAQVADVADLDTVEGLRWAGPIEPDDKTSPDLRRGDIGHWAMLQTRMPTFVITVQGQRSVTAQDVAAIVEASGGDVLDTVAITRTVTAAVDEAVVERLAEVDAVQFLEVAEPALDDLNDSARGHVGVDEVGDWPYNLKGTGVTVFMYESTVPDADHPDFGDRIIERNTPGVSGTRIGSHATHVAGTIIGDGTNSDGQDSAGQDNDGDAWQWAGMAPLAELRATGYIGEEGDRHHLPGAMESHLVAGVDSGFDVANMSAGHSPKARADDENDPACHRHGQYTNTSVLIDEIVTGAAGGVPATWVQAAGNERGGYGDLDDDFCGTHGTVISPATAKNAISVGNLDATSLNVASSSSWGPTNDGRVKPDLVAPGCSLKSPDYDWDEDHPDAPLRFGYDTKCGTSMAAPVVTGVAALVQQESRRQHGEQGELLPHTMRGLLIHTAAANGLARPRFDSGWGVVDAHAAVDLVRDDADETRIEVDEVHQGITRSWALPSDGSSAPRVTLAWDDPPATALTQATLVNDLDLRLVRPDGHVYEPWVRDPDNPTASRTRGNDDVNNVELVTGVRQEGTWQVLVTGTAVAFGAQEFTLVSSDPIAEATHPTVNFDFKLVTADEGSFAQNTGTYDDSHGHPVTLDASVGEVTAAGDGTWSWSHLPLDGPADSEEVVITATNEVGLSRQVAFDLFVENVAPQVAPRDQWPFALQFPFTDPGVEAGPFTAEVRCDVAGDEPFAAENVEVVGVSTEEGAAGVQQEGVVVAACVDEDLEIPYHVEVSVTDATGDTGTAVIRVDWPDLARMGVVGAVGDTLQRIRREQHEVFIFADEVDRAMTFEADLLGPEDAIVDVEWDWGDGHRTTNRHDLGERPGTTASFAGTVPPGTLAFTDTAEHTYTALGLHPMGLTVTFADGQASGATNAVVTGSADTPVAAGGWRQRIRDGAHSDTLGAYLDIAVHMSPVFGGAGAPRPLADVYDVLDVLDDAADAADAHDELDRQLLAAWLNFASGALRYDDPAGDDETFGAVVSAAEALRLDDDPDPQAVAAQLAKLAALNDGGAVSLRVERIAGPDRIETAIEVSRAAFSAAGVRNGEGREAGAVVLARADLYPDALAGTPLADALAAPLLLTWPGELDPRVRAEVDRVLGGEGLVWLLGSEAALSPAVEAALAQAGYDTVRLGGAERFETATRIADALVELGAHGPVLLATGDDFADALAAGAAAAHTDGVVLLAAASSVPEASSDWLARHERAVTHAVGGPAVQAMATLPAERRQGVVELAGAERTETAALVARELFDNVEVAGVAAGWAFPDALTGGAHTAAAGGPMLLTHPETLSSPVAALLDDAPIRLVHVYGGEAAVGAAVEAAIRAGR